MDKAIKATELSRHFSEFLNNVKFLGEKFTITRGGKPIATIGPIENTKTEATLGDLRSIVSKLPKLNDETKLFQDDMDDLLKHQPALAKDVP